MISNKAKDFFNNIMYYIGILMGCFVALLLIMIIINFGYETFSSWLNYFSK